MTTRELIEAVREPRRTEMLRFDGENYATIPATDYDALCAALAAVLDEVIRNCKPCVGTSVAVLEMEVGPDKRIGKYAATCPYCANARALRERVKR